MGKLVKAVMWLVALAALGGAGVLAYLGLTESGPEPAAAPQRRGGGAVSVEVAPVGHGTLIDRRVFWGTLEPRVAVNVAPKIAGRLEQLHVDAGDIVHSGDLIAELDDAEYQQEVAKAAAELAVSNARLAQAQSALEVSKREFARQDALRERKIVSEADLDAAQALLDAREADVRAAEAEVKQQEANLSGAKIRLSYTQVRASWGDKNRTGIVGQRFVDAGALLAANAPIISLMDIDPVRAAFFVTEKEYGRLRVGQPVAIGVDAYPGRVFDGKIVRLSPLFQETSRQARVEVEAANPDRLLKPGMFARLSIELGRAEGAAWVPVDAVVQRQGQAGVFLLPPGGKAVQYVPVATGLEQEGRIQIRQPADMAGRVVTLGHHLLSTGMQVRVAGEVLPPQGVPGAGAASREAAAGAAGVAPRGRPGQAAEAATKPPSGAAGTAP